MSTSLQIRCLEAVQSEIQGLALSGLPSAQVYAKKLPTDRDVTLPAVVCSLPGHAPEQLAGGLNQREDVGYPVLVTLIVAENQDLAINADADTHALWREKIVLHFHNQRLTGVSEVFTCKVEPRAIVDMDAFLNRNLLAGSLLVRCLARMPRT